MYSIKRVATAAAAAITTLILLASACAAAAIGEDPIFTRRLTQIFCEGMDLGGMVVGARGKVTVVYVDAKLADLFRRGASAGDDGVPDERMKLIAGYTGQYAQRKGMSLFLAAVESFKTWTFDTADVTVAGYAPAKDDILHGLSGVPKSEIAPGKNELPSGWIGIYGFYVPTSSLKPGTEVVISAAGYEKSWKVPSKKE